MKKTSVDKLRDRMTRCNEALNLWPEQLNTIVSGGHFKSISEFCNKNKIDHTQMSRVLSGERVPSQLFYGKVCKAIKKYVDKPVDK